MYSSAHSITYPLCSGLVGGAVVGSVVGSFATVVDEVAGRVVERNAELEVGTVLAKGDVLVRVNDADYEIALRRARAQLVQAQADLRLERGSQKLALISETP